MVGVRLVELFFLVAWAAGFWVFWRHTQRALLLGVYVGCTLSWTHDWVLAGPEIWKDKAGFKALNLKMSADAKAAADAAAQGKDAFAKAFAAVGQNCQGCHEKYRL